MAFEPALHKTITPGYTLTGVCIGAGQGLGGTGAATIAVSNFETWWGRGVEVITDYFGAHVTTGSVVNRMQQYQGVTAHMVWSMFVTPQDFQESDSVTRVGTHAKGLAGMYDAVYTTAAQNIVANGGGNATIRLGHECDGDWFEDACQFRGSFDSVNNRSHNRGTWAASTSYVINDFVQFSGTWYCCNIAHTSTASFDSSKFGLANTATSFKNVFAHVVGIMRAVSGFNCTFEYNCGAYLGWDPASSYPGDAYVDFMGRDQYDSGAYGTSAYTAQDHAALWTNELLPQLEQTAALSIAHNKPMALSEMGCMIRTDGHGGGDDPYYLSQLAAWIKDFNGRTSSPGMAYVTYFNSYDGTSSNRSTNERLAEYGTDTGSVTDSTFFPNAIVEWKGADWMPGALQPDVVVAPPPGNPIVPIGRRPQYQGLFFG